MHVDRDPDASCAVLSPERASLDMIILCYASGKKSAFPLMYNQREQRWSLSWPAPSQSVVFVPSFC